MANKMLIDAAHPEETRVVVLRGARVEEFDFESASKRQLRGNIYLAKVTRVEPSLQAAFVDYGGNRHGFLAFSEIHPDYYQIPTSDRQALMEEEQHEEPDEDEERRPRRSRRRRGGERQAASRRSDGDETISQSAEGGDHGSISETSAAHESGERTDASGERANEHVGAIGDGEGRPVRLDAEQTPPYDDFTADLIEHAEEAHAKVAAAPGDDATTHVAPASRPEASADTPATPSAIVAESQDAAEASEPATTDAAVDTGSSVANASAEADHADEDANGAEPRAVHQHVSRGERHGHSEHRREERHDDEEHDEEDEHVEQLGGDAMEEVPRRAYRPRKQYKIQEVIKRRQVLLVQVVKEERGNKGAALTTFLSLAGRYSVLMPNTAKGGGISRKITDAGDRQRLKSIAQDLEVPDGMGVILRTAGASRTKPEVKRDFEYLMRMWETVRETTLQSSAPTLVYEEGSLIKRAIRDLYNKDVEEVVVSGEEGYREAKDFMRLLMPSHTKDVQPWRDPAPIFTKAGAEAQLDAMFSPQVTLKSGGYLVINQTEALVAIDVNSGRSTREHNIEDTAVRTNLEAADEVARQLRLRDLAGLIVVDFIDMEENRNNRAVEKRLKDALKDDRARIQVGRISHFGLLEMSRQRIRTGVLEGSTVICEHCAGAGTVRSTASIALHVLRLLEDALLADASRDIVVRTRSQIALYILNHKRAHLSDIEGRFGAAMTFEGDESLTGTTYCALERGEPASGVIRPARQIVPIEEPEGDLFEESAADDEAVAVAGDARPSEGEESDGEGRRKRRRRRGRDRESSGIAGDAPQPSDDALSFVTDAESGGSAPVAAAGEGGGADGEAREDGEASDERNDGTAGGRRRRSRRGGRRTRGRDRDATENGEEQSGVGAAHGDHAGEVANVVVPPLTEQLLELDPVVAGGELIEAEAAPTPIAELPAAVAGPASRTAIVDMAEDPEGAATAAGPLPHGKKPSAAPAELESAPSKSALLERDAKAEPVAASSEPAAPRRPEPVSTEADPARPKRAGWWSRAKASLGG